MGWALTCGCSRLRPRRTTQSGRRDPLNAPSAWEDCGDAHVQPFGWPGAVSSSAHPAHSPFWPTCTQTGSPQHDSPRWTSTQQQTRALPPQLRQPLERHPLKLRLLLQQQGAACSAPQAATMKCACLAAMEALRNRPDRCDYTLRTGHYALDAHISPSSHGMQHRQHVSPLTLSETLLVGDWLGVCGSFLLVR